MTIYCSYCDEQQPSFLASALHIRTNHQGIDIGLSPAETAKLWDDLRGMKSPEWLQNILTEITAGRN